MGRSSRYKHPALRELSEQQLRFSSKEIRLEQTERAEGLIHQISPTEPCSYADVCERVTGYRPTRYPNLTIPGEDVRHDLRCFIEDVTDSIDLPSDAVDEEVLTVEDVSRRFHVSTKTVDRWRERGLVSRRFVFGKRKRIGFLQSSVDRFVNDNAADVARGSRFQHLQDDERLEILRRARQLARSGASVMESSRRIARHLNRSPEAIRYTIRTYDAQFPENAIFPEDTGVLSDETRQEIFRRHRRGVPVERLAEDYSRTKASIHRVLGEVRAERIAAADLAYIDNEVFHTADADDTIFAAAPVAKKGTTSRPPPGLPAYLASLYTVPLLTREQEQYWFRRMNFLKCRASELRDALPRFQPSTRHLNQIEKLLQESVEIKNFLIRSNLRLVVSIAKKHMRPGMNFFEMVSDGNMSLIRAIEKFDFAKGNKFSTYATWAIMKNYARSLPTEQKRRDRFRTGFDEAFAGESDANDNPFERQAVHQQQKDAILEILSQLDDRERDIIVQRFGLGQGEEPSTLEQVGSRLGVTKERIRQIESRALKKLRRFAVDERLDIPEMQ